MNYRELYKKADRNQMIADSLQQRAMQPRGPVQTGRITPQMHWGEGVAQIGEALLARRAGKKADASYEDATSARNQAMAEFMQGSPEFGRYSQAMESGVHPAIVGEMMARNRPAAPADEPVVAVMTEDGPKYVTRSQAAGMTPLPKQPLVQIGNGPELPKPPSGMYYEFDQQGNPTLVAIPGGPVATEQEELQRMAEGRAESSERKSDIILDEINRSIGLLDNESLPETGAVGNLLKSIPGTDASALASRLGTIRANIGFDRLQEMRENSPTGGALGNVTVQEIARLEAVLGDLDQSQREEDVRYNLTRLENLYLDTVHGEGNGPERKELPALSYRDGEQPAPADDPLSVLTPEQRKKYRLE